MIKGLSRQLHNLCNQEYFEQDACNILSFAINSKNFIFSSFERWQERPARKKKEPEINFSTLYLLEQLTSPGR